MLRPGNFDITEKALEKCNFKKNAKVLDVGCGHGDTANLFKEKYGLDPVGLDISLKMIEEGKEMYPGLDLRYGDGEFMDDFSSKTFDGVFMECVLSLISLPDEALHETYCVLKNGGKLVISDLFIKNPEGDLIKFLNFEAERQSKLPHQEGDCEEHKDRFVNFRYDGKFVVTQLTAYLEEIGFKVLHVEDRSKDLDEFAGQLILDGKKPEDCFCKVKDFKNTGYFYLVAEKR